MFQAFPLDMSQYCNLFNTTRLPQLGKDKLYHDETQKHVLILKGGNAYIFDVIDADGKHIILNKWYDVKFTFSIIVFKVLLTL